ncbi:MAG: alpha-L-rhamnosidase family protein [Pedosphaera sp.]|nr:alpha-L-rhamnosidase family protein [Pedosphaera sp.]
MKNINSHSWRIWLLALFIMAASALVVPAKETVSKTEANVMVELTFTAKQSYIDPFNQVTLDVVFVDPKGHELRVPAFWAGTNLWKVRYASPVTGIHRFHSECSETKDQGLQGITGKVEIKPYTGKNPLYAHGPIKLSANRRFMEYNDGTPFFWMGDTWWMGLSARLHWPEDVQKLAQDRKEKGFNVIQLVAGLFPDMHPFAEHGANEGGFPWTTNYSSIRPEYFDAADKRLLYLVDQGFTPVIVGAWGYFMQWMGVEKSEAHWRYLVARYGALPVVWCTAGEANLPWYLAKGFPYDDRKQVKDWTEVTRYLRATDPFHRLITIHPTGLGRLSARHTMDDLSLIDVDMLQTPHGQRDAVAPTVNTVRESYADQPVMPVIDGEASFEMLSDNLPTQWTRRMFWLCMMNGAAGHTYGANGIWQVNRQNDPHGPSPHHNGGFGYGKIPWDEAMNLGGSRQVGLGKKLLEQYPWQNFQSHPEWATFSGKSSLSLEGSQWIWYPEGNPAQDAPVGKRFFRRAFVLPEDKKIKSAQLRVSADDQFAVRVNGETVGASNAGTDTWKTGKQFNDFARLLKAGTNVFAITAENMPATTANPAGMIAHLEICFADGESLKLVSDASWFAAKSEAAGWDSKSFDDSSWEKAMVIGKYGDGPWGSIDSSDNSGVYGPQSAGIPGVVRVIYVPENNPIVVDNLGQHTTYWAAYFDPVTGAKTVPKIIKADASGSQIFPAPSGKDHDWVLILEAKKYKVLSSPKEKDLSAPTRLRNVSSH